MFLRPTPLIAGYRSRALVLFATRNIRNLVTVGWGDLRTVRQRLGRSDMESTIII
jgi:hypothetical protein